MQSLRDKYCIVGVGETEYSKNSGRTTRAMAVEAIRNALLDAGLRAADVDGMMSYQNNDSTPANGVAADLGIRLNFFMDVVGGGSSTEALVGLAMGAIEAGMCRAVAIFRSMNGYTDSVSAAPGPARRRRCGDRISLRCRSGCGARGKTSRSRSCATCTSTAPPPSKSPT